MNARQLGAPCGDLCNRRELSHFFASSHSNDIAPVHRRVHRHNRRAHVPAAILDPPNFYPEKLTVSYINDSSSSGPAPALPRRYTLTHNDMTGALKLTIGREYNTEQIAGFYTRLLRDEITAEWVQSSTGPSLHVHCHVSGEEKWLAPPILRNFIFRREMNLVLDTFLHADQQLLQQHPELPQATVLVHFHSDIRFLNRVEEWGTLGDRSSWQTARGMLFKDMWEQLIAWTLGDELDLPFHMAQQEARGAGAASAGAGAGAGPAQQQGAALQQDWEQQRAGLEATLASSSSRSRSRQEEQQAAAGSGAAPYGVGVPASMPLVAAAASATAAVPAPAEASTTSSSGSSSPVAAAAPSSQESRQEPPASASSAVATAAEPSLQAQLGTAPAHLECAMESSSSAARQVHPAPSAAGSSSNGNGSSCGSKVPVPVPVPVPVSSR